jgi:polyisoprenyl-phosphate glycosyltransferase
MATNVNATDIAATGAGSPAPEISVVLPVCDEAGNLDSLFAELTATLESCSDSFEILCVDDGSQDGTLDALKKANRADPRIRAISLSRNFGKEIAIAAGLDYARGRAVVIMDADFQHPPEFIRTFVEHWRAGYKNIYGLRPDRAHDSPVRRRLSQWFYQIFAAFGETPLPEGAGDFRLLDRQAVDALRSMGEQARFSKGLYAWIGFKAIGVPIRIDKRVHGSSKFSYRKLTRFAFDGLMSFSTVPLRVWTYVGTLISVLALATAVYIVVTTLVEGVEVPGYATLIVSIVFFAGVQLLSLGVIGEYVGRIFAEVKRRPLYLIAERIDAEPLGGKDGTGERRPNECTKIYSPSER